jgi:hypothetical protein
MPHDENLICFRQRDNVAGLDEWIRDLQSFEGLVKTVYTQSGRR